MKTLIAILFIALLLAQCRQNQSLSSDNPKDKLSQILRQMESETTVSMGYFLGKNEEVNSPYYGERFNFFRDSISEENLIALTKNPYSTIRCYSFAALVSRNLEKAKEVYLQRKFDYTSIQYHLGCLGGDILVKDFMLKEIKLKEMIDRNNLK